MAAPVWTGGTLKLPGDLVQPATVPATASATIPNAGFESGDVGWTKGAGWAIGAVAGSFQGANCAQCSGGVHNTYLESTTSFAVVAGQSITLSGVTNGGNATGNGAALVLAWYTAALALISRSEGAATSHSEGAWESGSFTAVAPAGAAFVRPGARGNVTGSGQFASVDSLAWNYTVPATADGLIYKAVQAAAGTTAASEPAWPATLGLQVIDGGVTWEATQASRVEWTAQPVLVSDGSEPVWPTGVGGVVVDGSIMWECVSRSVTDPKCPHTKEVVIAASKVYAADGDIIRYSATVNPLDWSTADDAGYLPYGLQNYGASPVAALGLYRSNVVGFNAQGFQMWQVDEDPANSALLDALPIGSTWHRALSPVSNDLLFLSSQGVRTIGIAGGSSNLAAGDAGMPIDPLVQDAVRVALANGSKALATWYPSEGQYWLAFSDYPPAALAISGGVPGGYVGESVTGSYVVSGGVKPYGAITVTSGTFPAGLTLNPDGSYSGSRTTEANYSWTVGGVDADGTPFSLADSATVTALAWFTSSTTGIVKSTTGLATDWLAAPAIEAGYSIYSGGGKVINTRTTGAGKTSSDTGGAWTSHAGLAAASCTQAVLSNSTYLIAANSNTVNRSADGIAYSPIVISSAVLSGNLNAITASASLVMVGAPRDFNNRNIAISTDDGATFPSGSLAFIGSDPRAVLGLANNGSRFVAVGSTNRLAYTDDGSTWTQITSPFVSTTSNVVCITYGGGVWVAANALGEIAWSLDAVTWTLSASAFGAIPAAVAYGAGRYIMVGASTMKYSVDACVTWTAITHNQTGNITGITAYAA